MSRWLKRLGVFLGCIVLFVVLFAGFAWYKSSDALATTYTAPAETVAVAADSATLMRGKHLTITIAKCVDCHGPDLAGTVFIDDPALGRVIAPNLTKGVGGIGDISDAQLEQAIRHGIKRDGKSVLVMPSDDYQYLTNADLSAIIAYVRSVPSVDKTLPSTGLKGVGRALLAAGQLPILTAARVDHQRTHPGSIVMDTSVQYGKYLADVGGCTGCHGPGLSGGKIPGVPPEIPPAANLTPKGIGHYTDAQLVTILRTGKRPDGSTVNEFMPWKRTAEMTDDEMNTTIKFLRTAPPKEFGGR